RRLWLLPLALISGAPAERRSRRTRPGRGAAHGCAAFSAGAGCPLGKSRRLRGPDAQRRARRRGVLSLRQVSLHKQRKVARAVTARKLLILIRLAPHMDEDQEQLAALAPSSALRAPSPAGGRRADLPASHRRSSGGSRWLSGSRKELAAEAAPTTSRVPRSRVSIHRPPRTIRR